MEVGASSDARGGCPSQAGGFFLPKAELLVHVGASQWPPPVLVKKHNCVGHFRFLRVIADHAADERSRMRLQREDRRSRPALDRRRPVSSLAQAHEAALQCLSQPGSSVRRL